MKKQPSLRLSGAIILAIIGGACLGYVQDGITTGLIAISFLSFILIVGMIGWVIGVVWYGAALRFPLLPRFGIEPILSRLILILLWWLFTVIGGVIFLSLHGTIIMPLLVMIAISAGMGMAYNFFLVVLPSFIYWMVSRKNRQGRSSAKRRARRHE